MRSFKIALMVVFTILAIVSFKSHAVDESNRADRFDKLETEEYFDSETETPFVRNDDPAKTVPPPVIATPIKIEHIAKATNTELSPIPERPTYSLQVTYDYDAHTLDVDEEIVYPNRTGEALQYLVLAVIPNSWPDCFQIESLSIRGERIDNYILTGRRMEVALPMVVAQGKVVTIVLHYRLNLPFIEEVDPTIAGPRIFGYTARQQNLTNWYPFVVPFMGGEWVLHEPSYQGEFLVYEASDFDVSLKFIGPGIVPVVASSGYLETGIGKEVSHYTLKSARTFVLSVSREYQVQYVQTGNVFVYSYYFQPFGHEGKAALNSVAKAIEIYNEKFGPYPHQSMSIVMGDFRGSMEHSALFFHGYTACKLYDGTENNEFISIAVHETAHQWWFDQVGNDQALSPWLDEALSTYSERIYYEVISPESVNGWWWPIRVDLYSPGGFVDIKIYDTFAYRPYINEVYLQGAHFLEKLRARIGEKAFFSFLQEYYSQQTGTIVTPDIFWGVLEKYIDTDISDLVDEYFRIPLTQF